MARTDRFNLSGPERGERAAARRRRPRVRRQSTRHAVITAALRAV